jgi:hypothetical protein
MIAMAAACTDTATAISGDVVTPRRRGKSKAPNFRYEGPVSVIRLELDVTDERMLRRLARLWSAAFRLRRALQRDAQHRCQAYGAAHHERGADPKALRERLGLSRKGIEAAAKAHIERSGWMRDHLTKAVGLHLADEVWETVDRHLFADGSGRRHGPPRIGSWWEFTRIPGRARSHTKDRPVWETWRLVGTLDGHLEAYRHPQLAASVSAALDAAAQPAGFVSDSTQMRRAAVLTARRAGVDANVSNLSLASFPNDHPEQLVVDQITCTPEQQETAAKAALRTRARQKALDRSRRNTNPDQYSPSARQHKRAARRAEKGLPAKQIANPGGPRHARADRVPLRAYRHDSLSGGYHRTRVDHAAAARSASQAKRARAGEVAARIVASHGNTITVEDCSISTWARLWGKRIALFSPGMLVAALQRECEATGGTLSRASTRSTALSQHCLCGTRVAKTLAQRIHDCPQCGLHGDRDIVSAALAACVTLTDPDDPRTARVDYRLAHALRAWLASQQEWEGSVNRHQPPAPPDGAESARAGSHHSVASAEQAALGPPPNRPGTPGRRGTSRKQQHPKLFGAA